MRSFFVPFIIVVAFGCATPDQSTQSATVSNKLSPIVSFHATADSYLSAKEDRAWWIDQPVVPPTAQQTQRMNDISKGLTTALKQYQSASPIVEEIAGYFKDVYFGYEFNGQPVSTVSDEVITAPKTVGIIFYSRADQGQHPAKLYYSAEKRAVMVAAIDWNQTFAVAAILHELGHALYQFQGKPSASAPDNSDEWIEEEVAMHELEMKLLDVQTAGQYLSVAKGIVSRMGRSDFDGLLSGVTKEDLDSLDNVLGSPSSDEAGSRATQHLLTLAILQTQGDRKKLVACYRILAGK